MVPLSYIKIFNLALEEDDISLCGKIFNLALEEDDISLCGNL